MVTAFIILDSADIALAEGILSNIGAGDYKTFIFDPTLRDKVATSKLKNLELIPWSDCLDYADLFASSRNAAHDIGRSLDQAVQSTLQGASIHNWQFLHFYYLLIAVRWYGEMWKALHAKLADYEPHIFVCDNPSEFYWPSFIPTLLLIQALQKANIRFKAYTHGKRKSDTNVVPNVLKAAQLARAGDVLTHLPTCFYDHAYFSGELAASKRRVLHINSKYWDVELANAEHVGLARLDTTIPGISAETNATIEETLIQLREALNVELRGYLTLPAYHERQVEHMVSNFRAQLATYFMLRTQFANKRPAQAILSDHDAGFHGPLISFCRDYDIPVLMLPHSKTSADIEFSYANITVLNHPVQGLAVLNGDGRRAKAGVLAYPEILQTSSAPSSKLKTLGLLLNGISLNGVMATEYGVYLQGIAEISAWCKRNGVNLRIRCRQGQSLFSDLTAFTDVTVDDLSACMQCSLVDFAKSVELCLMYDAPTNADIDFLKNGIPILNPIPSRLADTEAGTVKEDLVPRADVKSTLARLDAYLNDPLNLHLFRMRQFAIYAALQAQAMPLSSFL